MHPSFQLQVSSGDAACTGPAGAAHAELSLSVRW